VGPMYLRLLRHHISPHPTTKHLAYYAPASFSTTSAGTTESRDKLRVAIVGGGVSGLSLALHLAPLAERGLIAQPIDLYERSSLNSVHPHERGGDYGGAARDENFHPGTGAIGRDIGVGVWHTALEPFLHLHPSTGKVKARPREGHINMIEKLMDLGQWVGAVGYRIPSGRWLTRDYLDTRGFEDILSSVKAGSSTKIGRKTEPGLLFLREKDFLTALRDAIMEEQGKGNIQTYFGTTVEEIIPESSRQAMSGQLRFSDKSTSSSETPYNLVVAADGMSSVLRSKYGSNESPDRQRKLYKKSRTNYERTASGKDDENTNDIDDRQYTVYRGNSSMSNSEAGTNGDSFQTWGEQKSMRFAVVGMSHPNDDSKSKERVQKQVWFATTSVSEISAIQDPEKRKKRLLKCFKNWHSPVSDLIESTPADQIYMERAVAHKHDVFPVFDVARIQQRQDNLPNPGVASGPVLLFLGDANMTVDPVLAQGFTIAMETSADLARTIDLFLTSNNPSLDHFDMNRFKKVISARNEQLLIRILCLLRATDLVQALAQPHTGSFFGYLSKYIVRPAIYFTPNFLKKPAFASVMKYSLGLFDSVTITDTMKEKNRKT